MATTPSWALPRGREKVVFQQLLDESGGAGGGNAGPWTDRSYKKGELVQWGGSTYITTGVVAAGAAPPTGIASDPGTDDDAVNAGWAVYARQGDPGTAGAAGAAGATGGTGATGAAAAISSVAVNTLAPGANATVANTGTSGDAHLVFGIPAGVQGDPGPQGPGYARAVADVTTAVLAPGASATLAVDMAKGYVLSAIATSRPARVQVYETVAARAADAARAVGTDPAGDAGVVLDYVTTDTNPHALGPQVLGRNAENPVTISVPIRVTNNGTNGTVQVLLTWLRVE